MFAVDLSGRYRRKKQNVSQPLTTVRRNVLKSVKKTAPGASRVRLSRWLLEQDIVGGGGVRAIGRTLHTLQVLDITTSAGYVARSYPVRTRYVERTSNTRLASLTASRENGVYSCSNSGDATAVCPKRKSTSIGIGVLVRARRAVVRNRRFARTKPSESRGTVS